MKHHEFDLADLDSPEAPVRRLVKLVLLTALRDRATVIRFEEADRAFRMCYKVDGVFLEMVPPPLHLGQPILNLLRVIAHLDYATGQRPNRGFGHVRLGDYVVHLFVNIRAGSYGETIDVSLLHSPECCIEADQQLEAFACPESRICDDADLEWIDFGDDMVETARDYDYLLRR